VDFYSPGGKKMSTDIMAMIDETIEQLLMAKPKEELTEEDKQQLTKIWNRKMTRRFNQDAQAQKIMKRRAFKTVKHLKA
jgi:hypothetical protein